MKNPSRLPPLTVSPVCSVIIVTTCTPGQPRVSGSQPVSGVSETLGHQSPAPRRPDYLQSKRPSLLSKAVRKLLPGLHEKLWHTVTEPRRATLLPDDIGGILRSSHGGTTVVPYLTFPTIVGKNSAFKNLTQEQLGELGGIEFRALNMLMWAVPLVCHDRLPV